jgi:hypothetical protein
VVSGFLRNHGRADAADITRVVNLIKEDDLPWSNAAQTELFCFFGVLDLRSSGLELEKFRAGMFGWLLEIADGKQPVVPQFFYRLNEVLLKGLQQKAFDDSVYESVCTALVECGKNWSMELFGSWAVALETATRSTRSLDDTTVNVIKHVFSKVTNVENNRFECLIAVQSLCRMIEKCSEKQLYDLRSVTANCAQANIWSSGDVSVSRLVESCFKLYNVDNVLQRVLECASTNNIESLGQKYLQPINSLPTEEIVLALIDAKNRIDSGKLQSALCNTLLLPILTQLGHENEATVIEQVNENYNDVLATRLKAFDATVAQSWLASQNTGTEQWRLFFDHTSHTMKVVDSLGCCVWSATCSQWQQNRHNDRFLEFGGPLELVFKVDGDGKAFTEYQQRMLLPVAASPPQPPMPLPRFISEPLTSFVIDRRLSPAKFLLLVSRLQLASELQLVWLSGINHWNDVEVALTASLIKRFFENVTTIGDVRHASKFEHLFPTNS